MKSAKSVKSMSSFRSSRSFKSTLDNASRRAEAKEFVDLATVLPTVCNNLQCPYDVVVTKKQQTDDFYKSIKYGDTTPHQRKRISILPPKAPLVSQTSETKTSTGSKSVEQDMNLYENAITVTGVYDTYNCLIELLLSNIEVPRILIQVIALLVPYYQNLTTLTVRNCKIDFYTIHEISKILELSTITSICLDNSPIIQRTYETLLNENSSLLNLTLSKLKLDDDDCKQIAAKLHHGAAAEKLQTLNLSSNHITDVGAKYISEALRTNRHLRYLNLQDNWINDEGAISILAVLREFSLTSEEVVDMRLRYMKFLRWKQTLYEKYLTQSSFDDLSQISRKSAKKKKGGKRETKLFPDEDPRERAEILANEILGHFNDPFDSESAIRRDNSYYCKGNMQLCYLNLSYNNLSYISVKKLHNIVMYQNVSKKSYESGIVKVLIEGNNIPIICQELITLNEIFSRTIRRSLGKTEFKRRRSRVI